MPSCIAILSFILLFGSILANAWPLDGLHKREISMDARQMLIEALTENGNDGGGLRRLSDPLRRRFADIAAFSYSLLSTYTYTALSSRTNSMFEKLSELVPAQFKAFFGPPENGSGQPSQAEEQELKCVNKCIKEVEQQMMDKMVPGGVLNRANNDGLDEDGDNVRQQQEPITTAMAFSAFSRLNCSDEIHGRDCLIGCHEESGGSMYSEFLISELNLFLAEYCPQPTDQIDVLQILDTCQLAQMAQIAFSFTFSFGKEFISAFNKANDDPQKCSAVKKILIDEFSTSMSAICGNSKQAKLVERMMHTTASYALAQNTKGAIFRRCPDVYNISKI